ncbi:hypothetical protein V8E53_012715 [Lactarius tabidus]
MFTNKREPESSHCATVCWADFVVLSLILLVVVYVFLGVPLTARLCKWFKRSRSGYSRPLSTSSSMHHTRRGHSMFPRRQGSDETLLEGLVDVGNDKVDDAIPLDPFLVVQPSLNNSMLVKQGLVEETVLPPPMHSAHDIQGLQSRRGETSPRKRPLSGTETAMPPPLPRSKSRATSVDTLILSPTEARTFDKKVKEVLDAERGAVVVPLPPPAYTPYPPVGQGRRGSVV